MITLGRFCPSCRGSRIFQSRRRSYDLPFWLLLLKGVRCGECDYRFYRPRFFKALPRVKRVLQMERRSA